MGSAGCQCYPCVGTTAYRGLIERTQEPHEHHQDHPKDYFVYEQVGHLQAYGCPKEEREPRRTFPRDQHGIFNEPRNGGSPRQHHPRDQAQGTFHRYHDRRGMCGATNSGVIRQVRALMNENRKTSEITLAIAGSKGAQALRRDFNKSFHTNVQELGKRSLSFVDVEPLVNVLDEVTEYDKVRIISNQWESVVASRIMHRLLPNPKNMVDEMKDSYY